MTLSDLQKIDFLFDSHAHLGFDGYKKHTEAILNLAKSFDVLEIFDVSVDTKSSIENVKRASEYSMVKALVGIDPEVLIPGSEMYTKVDNIDEWLEQEFKTLEELIIDNPEQIIGIGETGIDLHHLKAAKTPADLIEESRELQIKLFRKHLELAQRYNYFISIHSRGAEQECLEILKEYKVNGIFHSFTGNLEIAKQILESGNALGVNGIVTFKNATDLKNLYKTIIGEVNEELNPSFFYKKGIFFETDAPFLAPEGKRGEINESANIRIIFDEFVKIIQG